MCDFISWGQLKNDHPELNLKKDQLLWLTDDMILAKWGPDADFHDFVGHTAISKYYGINEYDFYHLESAFRIPAQIASDVNAGRMRRMAQAYRPDAVSWRFPEQDEEGYLFRPRAPRDICLKDVAYTDCNSRCIDTILQVLKHIQSLESFPKGLHPCMDAVIEKLKRNRKNPAKNLNPFEHPKFTPEDLVDTFINWSRSVKYLRRKGTQVTTDDFFELNVFVSRNWRKAVDAIYPVS